MAEVAAIWSTGIPWNQEPAYVAACRSQLQPGDPTSYNPPRNVGPTPTDITGFQVGSAGWDINNLPDIFYILWPCTEWRDFASSARPAQKVDASGNLLFERHPWPGTQPRPMLNFPIFRDIDTISTEVEWELIEWWMRIDPRISWDDIEMRMEHIGKRAAYDHTIDMTDQDWPAQVQKAKANFHNLLNMRTQRQGRVPFNMLLWRNKKAMHEKKNRPRDEVLGRLTPQQKAANSTRGATPGLIDVNAPDNAANRVTLPGRQRQQRALPQVAPENMSQAQNNVLQNAFPQTYTQINGVAQPQVLLPNVPRLQSTVPQQSNVQHQFRNPDFVSSQVIQQDTTYNGSAAPPFSIPQPQQPAPSSMAPSQLHHNQQVFQQIPPINLRQAGPPPPRPRGTLQGQPHGLGGVPTIQQRQTQQLSLQYMDPNIPLIQASATPTPDLRSQDRVPSVSNFIPQRQNQRFSRPPPPPPRMFNQPYRAADTQHPAVQAPYRITAATSTAEPEEKRTASSAFTVGGFTNGEIIDLESGDYSDIEPARPQKRSRTDSRRFEPVANDATSRRGTPTIKDGKRKREPDNVPPPHEGGYPQQPQSYYPQAPPRKRQQLRSLTPQINPVLPGDLEPENVAKHLAGIGQPPTTRPLNSRSSLPSSGKARQSSASLPTSQIHTPMKPSLGNQPVGIGPRSSVGPNAQRSRDQGCGDSHVNPMSLAPMTSPPSFQQRDHQSGRRVNRGLEYPNVLAPTTRNQRVTKKTSQRQPSVRGRNSQHLPANYLGGLLTSTTNEHPRVTRIGSYEAGASSHGVAGPDPEVRNTQGYVHQGHVLGPYPHTTSRSGMGAVHSPPAAYMGPALLHRSSSPQDTPQRRSDTVQGPYPTPANIGGTTPHLNPQLRGAHYGQIRGPSLTSSPLQEQLEPGLSNVRRRQSRFSDEDAARFFVGEDDSGQQIKKNSDEHNINDTDDKHGSTTTKAFEAIDKELFEALLRNEGQDQFSTNAIEIPEAFYIGADFSQTEVDKWNAEAQATIDRLIGDGNNAGLSTDNAAASQEDDAQSSPRKVDTEQAPAEDFQEEDAETGFDASKPSKSTEEDLNSLGAPPFGPEHMRLLELPFDVSEFSVEDEHWLLEQDSSDLF